MTVRQGYAIPTEELLARCSFLCAREIKAFGDLTPMEVEALLREALGSNGSDGVAR